MGFDLDRVVAAFDFVGIDPNDGEDYPLEEAYIGDITARLLGEPWSVKNFISGHLPPVFYSGYSSGSSELLDIGVRPILFLCCLRWGRSRRIVRESICTLRIPIYRSKIVSFRLHLQESWFGVGLLAIPSYVILI